MKLFLIQQDYNNGYDTFDSVVVAAPDEATAIQMDPHTGRPMRWDCSFSWAKSPEQVTCKYLGETEEPQGVICASFNAG